MATFNLLKKTAEERKSEMYGLAPYLVYKVGDKTYNYGGKATEGLFYNGALSSKNPTEILSIGGGVATLRNLAYGVSSLTKVHCENWDVSGVASMVGTFNETSIEEFDGRKWNTGSLTSSGLMFWDCTTIKRCGLFAIRSGATTTQMFDGCTALTDVRCGGAIYPSISFDSCPLTAASVIDILAHLATTPDSGATVTFKSGLYATYTTEEKAIIDELCTEASINGWTVVNMALALSTSLLLTN